MNLLLRVKEPGFMVEGSGFRRTGQRQASESVSTAATTSPDDKDVFDVQDVCSIWDLRRIL